MRNNEIGFSFLLSRKILGFQMKIRKENASVAYFSGSWTEKNIDRERDSLPTQDFLSQNWGIDMC